MSCVEALRVQAYFDGELDASAALEVERHLEHCADCAALIADLEESQRLIRESATYHRMGDGLRAQVGARLDREAGQQPKVVRPLFGDRRVLFGAFGGAGATALAAALAAFLILPGSESVLIGGVADAHLRSLMPDHLIDVASSDHHTVKPWFAGHADVSPPVTDFKGEGYQLIGGRADYVEGHRAAVVVYRHGAHVINVFSWAAGDEKLPESVTRNGYHFVFWKGGNLAFCAVSDTGRDELLKLVSLIKTTMAPDIRE